jgi:peptide chain release factor 1
VDDEQRARWRDELRAVEASLADPAVLRDQGRLRQVSRRHKELLALVEVADRLAAARADEAAARELLGASAGEERQLARAELEAAEAAVSAAEADLRRLMVPADPNDGRDVIVEIRGAEGGEEANLFARDLFEMYRRYAERHGLAVEVLSASASDLSGFDQVTFVVRGDEAWRRFKYEGGPHRVQRVPATESQGRVHTSSATVTVLPQAEEVELAIDPADLRIDVYRSTGPGGQSVNTTDSAVRITHLPTGTVVAMQDEKSQIQNRAKAMAVLRSRLLQMERDRLAAEQSSQRRQQVGGGGRSEKIRTYHFKENRVTDHRIRLTLHKLDRVLMGELDEIVDQLAAAEHLEHLADADGAGTPPVLGAGAPAPASGGGGR